MSSRRSPIVRSESLLASDAEKNATSKSLYGDHKARVSANVGITSERIRTQAVSNALTQSVKGKSVLHLGCGVGLFAMMAARAMAKLVVAVDTSSIVEHSAEIARVNSLPNLKFFRGTVQDVQKQLDPEIKFDIILCEWVGAFLTNEKVLRELLWAKKHLLAPGGMICPDKSSLHVVGITDYQYYQQSVEYWENVYGFSMKPMIPLVMQEASTCAIPKNFIVTSACPVYTADIARLEDGGFENLGYASTFSIKATKKATLHFLTFYVDCSFTHPTDPGANFVIGYNLGGFNCWTEVSIPLNEHIPLNVNETVTGTISVQPNEKGTLIRVDVESNSAVAKIKTHGEYTYTY